MEKSEPGGTTGISSGFLRTKISLKGNQSQLSLVSPFYGMKPELPPQSQLLGSEDLISLFDLSGSYNRYCGFKKPREDLASFLPHVCGVAQINRKSDASCSLRQLIEKPPIMGKEINSLSASQIIGFKLAPGPVPDSNRHFDLTDIPAELAGTTLTHSQTTIGFDQYDFNKCDSGESKHGKKMKRTLDEIDDAERKLKKHKNEEKEKKKKKKKDKKKKDREKERKNVDEEKKTHKKDTATPFF